MRKRIAYFLILPLFVACNQNDSQALLTGSVTNFDKDFFLLSHQGQKNDTVFVGEDGSFEFTFGEIEEHSNYYMVVDKNASGLYISPGHHVLVNFDAKEIMETISYQGDGADINNYLVAKANNTNYKRPNPEMYGLEYGAYKSWADHNLEAQNELLSKTIKDNPNDAFWATEEGDILYGWASQLGMYSIYYKRFGAEETVTLPDNYLDYKKALDFNKPEYLESRSFITFLQSEIPMKVRKDNVDKEGFDLNVAILEAATEEISNQKVLDFFSAQYLRNQMSNQKLKDLEPAISLFKERTKDQEAFAYFDEDYQVYLKISEGQQAFDFSGENIDGATVKLSDFHGNYVYVDVWATWCAPCKREIPFLKELEADYHNRNIVFLSYSIDSDKQAWLDFVPKNNLGGVQLIGEDAWKSEMPVQFKVSGVPTFMLFSPDGKVISTKMTRPSDPETRTTFEGLKDL